ncbi:MAG: glutamine amidotransferase [Rhodoglobus sp.]
MAKILLAGESWSTTSVHTKGFDSFITSIYEEGAKHFIGAVERGGHSVVFQPNHVAAEHFPTTVEELAEFDLVVLSDIGANTLLLPHRVFVGGETMPNRLDLLAEWVRQGGSLLMVGGYLSFQGIEAKANYRNTSLASVLPVVMESGDDRIESPQGATPRLLENHPATHGVPQKVPPVLGYHRFEARTGASVLMAVDERPFLVVDNEGEGRVAAFASDMGPHWLPQRFLDWDGFDPMWQALVGWLVRDSQEK